MSLDFTAIDFETANPSRGSVCSVGMAKFRDGQLVDSYEQLVRPPPDLDSFAYWNVRVHGINFEAVKQMPTWDVVFPAVDEFIGDDLLVAHNAAFDISVLVGACAAYQLELRPNEYACTLESARARLDLADFKLPTVAAALGIELARHHDALSDAVATGEIAVALSRGRTAAPGSSTDSDAAGESLTPDLLGADRRRRAGVSGRGSSYSSFRPAAYSPSADADPSHFFFGKKFVFTGQLETLSREEAAELVVIRGGRVTGSVSKLTSVLVVGGWDPTLTETASRGLSAKAAKAMAVLEAGYEIHIWTEQDLIANL